MSASPLFNLAQKSQSSGENTISMDPPIETSLTGAKIIISSNANRMSNKPKVLFSGELRRLTMVEFKEWMAPLPLHADIITLVLIIDRAVTSLREYVESYETLDYFACRILINLCPPSQKHLKLRTEDASTWAEKRQIILNDKCSAEYFTALENEINQVRQEQATISEKVQRTESLLEQHETISRTLKRDTPSENKCRDIIYKLFDTYSALILKQTVSAGSESFVTFLNKARKLAQFLDQRERNQIPLNALNIVTKEKASNISASANNEELKIEIQELKSMILQMEGRHKRKREEEIENSFNKLHMVVPHRMSRSPTCESCSKFSAKSVSKFPEPRRKES